MSEEEYDLSKSEKKLGQLYPILKDKHGNIIDGFHRQNTDSTWKSITLYRTWRSLYTIWRIIIRCLYNALHEKGME